MLLKCDEIVIRGNLFNAELLILEKRQPERKEPYMRFPMIL